MRVRVLTLKFDPLSGTIDDRPLQEFSCDKEIISVSDHFFMKDNSPYLTLLITWQTSSGSDIQSNKDNKKAAREDWRDFIKEADVPLFNTLREWRSERSGKEGLPPYIICTNKQLGKMLEKRPQTLSELGSLEGFGKAKLDKYGREILDIFSKVSSSKKVKDSTKADES